MISFIDIDIAANENWGKTLLLRGFVQCILSKANGGGGSVQESQGGEQKKVPPRGQPKISNCLSVV